MELRQLECFVKAIEMNSISRAAESLYISQPALSLSIKSLERDLGVQLIVRDKRQITPSPIGNQVYEYAREILSKSLAIYRTAASIKDSEQKRIVVKVTAASALIPQLIQPFRARHPDVDIILIQNETCSERADIEIGSSLEPVKPISGTSVLKETIALAVPAWHPLSTLPYIEPQHLNNQKIISLKEPECMRSVEKRYCETTGVRLIRTIECDSPETLCALISCQAGLAFVPERTWFLRGEDQFKLIPLVRPGCSRYIHISWNQNTEDLPSAMRFFDASVRFFHALSENGKP